MSRKTEGMIEIGAPKPGFVVISLDLGLDPDQCRANR
jgi:hypothetical protein